MCKQSVVKALRYIRTSQEPSGGFVSQSSAQQFPFTPARSYTTTFATSLIAEALSEISAARPIIEKAAAYLLQQASPQFTWNYWDRSSTEATSQPYPDDLDDTACAIAALAGITPAPLTGTAIAKYAHHLVHLETKPGGPYRTWFVKNTAPKVWRDVDAVVNANCAYSLQKYDVHLPNIDALIEKALKSSNHSVYYPTSWISAWLLFRAYQGEQGKAFVPTYKKLAQQSFPDPLQTACHLLLAKALGLSLREQHALVTHLLETQLPDGSWAAAAFCLDPSIKGTPHFSGSSALTTAYCVQALYSFEKQSKPSPDSLGDTQQMMSRIQTICATAPAELARETSGIPALVRHIEQKTAVLTLPHLVARAYGLTVGTPQLEQLGVATALGWVAYTEFDKILDEPNTQHLLPAALFTQRLMIREYTKAFKGLANAEDFLAESLLKIDQANAWEQQSCMLVLRGRQTLPDFSDYHFLAWRSYGHLVTPISLMHLGKKSEHIPNLRVFFEQFIIARQLNDDAHDWQEDLLAGRINAVASHILQTAKLPVTRANLKKHLPSLEKVMANTVLLQICAQIEENLETAKTALLATKPQHPELLLDLLLPVASAVSTARREHAFLTDFIKEYRKEDA